MTGKAVDFCREDTPPLGGNAAAQCLKADVLCFGKYPVYRAFICYILSVSLHFKLLPRATPPFTGYGHRIFWFIITGAPEEGLKTIKNGCTLIHLLEGFIIWWSEMFLLLFYTFKLDFSTAQSYSFLSRFTQTAGDCEQFCMSCNFYFFCKYTRNVYKSTVETSVQCKLSKLKMDITLNLFCTFHDKRDCHRQQQNKLAFIRRGKKSVSDFRPSKCGYHAEEQFKEKQNNNNNKKRGGVRGWYGTSAHPWRRASFI